jgi:MoxR-like ATPase
VKKTSGGKSAPAAGTGAPGVGATAQRPPAEVVYAEELARLAAEDADAARPPGWRLSPRAVRAFILGDPARQVRQKFVGHPSLVDRAMVALATSRGLLLVGEPGTAKSLLSELLAAAIGGDSTLTIQGSAATTEDDIKYTWNYALLLAEGPTPQALVPAPLYRGMQTGQLVRFEEITRCPLEVQDALLAPLSDRVLAVPELDGGMLFAQPGFNVIATANTRDLGVNEMSAALKRRFNFETVFPIQRYDVELALVRDEARRALERSGVPEAPSAEILELLVTTFRELRSGQTVDGRPLERPSTAMSTAEAVSVAHAVGVRAHFLGGSARGATPADLVECLVGAAIKTDANDVTLLRRYFEQRVAGRTEAHWRSYFEARHRLPE